MTGWIPFQLSVTAIVDEAQTRRLEKILPAARLDVLANHGSKERITRGHGEMHEAYQKVQMDWSVRRENQVIYCESLRWIMSDQIDSIRDSAYQRTVVEEDGLESLRYATAALRLSRA